MTSADIADHGGQEAVARLRELLDELERGVPAPRSDPNSQRRLALCVEVESILRMRYQARSSRQVA